MGVRFALLAEGAAFNIFSDKLGETRPPVFSSDELVCFQVARVACRGVVMHTRDDIAAESVFIRNVDSVLVGEKATVSLPVGEVRAEGRVNGAIEGLESVLYQGIIARG
jgi:hypothetical protein